MTFRKAAEGTPDVADAWRPGLQAISSINKEHMRAETPQRLRGSVNVDETLREEYPQEPRWDYAVGHQPVNGKGEMIYWIEIHPASEHGVTEVLNKLQWLTQWLNDSAPLLREILPAFIWVSSGKTSFTARSPQARKLARAKVRNVGRFFVIPDKTSD